MLKNILEQMDELSEETKNTKVSNIQNSSGKSGLEKMDYFIEAGKNAISQNSDYSTENEEDYIGKNKNKGKSEEPLRALHRKAYAKKSD